MTAINYLLQRDRVVFYGDGANYGTDGVLRAVSGKICLAPNLPAMFMSRGATFACTILAQDFAMRFSDFDELVDEVEDALPKVIDQYSQFVEVAPDIQLIFGGWSTRRNRPEAYFIGANEFHLVKTEGAVGDVVAPPIGKKELLTGGGNLPCLTEADMKQGWAKAPDSVDDVGDIAQYARTVLELQRQKKFDSHHGCGEIHVVGGLGELVTLTKDKIETQIICRWPDEIGSPIEPAVVDWAAWRARQRRGAAPALSLVSSAPQGMNRQQRRAWEAQNRRRV